MTQTTERLSSALADRYKILRHLGEGGMATVYLAEDLKHKRQVAVKVLKPELAAVLGAERFVQEITTTASLQHPHILPLFDSGEADSFLYYVMPYIEGETLRSKLDRETQFGIEEAVKITAEVADALDYAHRHGIIHRDIKPENILLHDGRPMVADFGIALAVSAAAGGRMTETGLSLGTPHYMSPEQATAEKEITARSDVYSLGSVLYEMLAGAPPHLGGSAQQIIMKIISEDAAPVTTLRKSVPVNVAAAVAMSLEKLPADRFDSAAAFAQALTDRSFTSTAMGIVAGDEGGPGAGMWKSAAIVATVLAVIFGIVALRTSMQQTAQTVSRYLVTFPQDEVLPSGPVHVAISPDGQQLVYVGPSLQGGRLWLKRRDELNARPIPDTETARAPFFSPDGTRIVFHSRNSNAWRMVSLNGGPSVTLADSGTSRGGGSWGPDGYVYLGGRLPGDGLARLPATGGPLEVMTVTNTDGAGGFHIWPEVLPSGRGVLFTDAMGSGTSQTDWNIAVLDLETRVSTVLVQGVRARYAASGHLLYVTGDGTLMAAPFDDGKLTLTGDPVALAGDVRIPFLGEVSLTVSTTGMLFYTVGSSDQTSGQELVWVARDGAVAPIDSTWTGNINWPRLSPSGTRLAVSIDANAEEQVWVKELDHGPLPKLTYTGPTNQRPSWTPDGRSVAFASIRNFNNLDIYLRPADGTGEARLLVDEPRPVEEIVFSPDGEWIVYRVGGANRERDLYIRRIDEDTAVARIASDFDEAAPAISPDGRWLAYGSDRSGSNQVYVRPFPNIEDGLHQVSTTLGSEPVWAHNGRELFYKEGGSLMSVEVIPGPTFITGERRELFSISDYSNTWVHQQYDVAPDDQRFVMIRSVTGARPVELVMVGNVFEELNDRVGR